MSGSEAGWFSRLLCFWVVVGTFISFCGVTFLQIPPAVIHLMKLFLGVKPFVFQALLGGVDQFQGSWQVLALLL